jgi:hypothetical protein
MHKKGGIKEFFMTQADPGDTNQDNDRRQSLDPEMFKKMQQMQELLP